MARVELMTMDYHCRAEEVQSLYVVSNKDGQQVSYSTLRSWFRTTRDKAGVNFQMRDLISKSTTDTENVEPLK